MEQALPVLSPAEGVREGRSWTSLVFLSLRWEVLCAPGTFIPL